MFEKILVCLDGSSFAEHILTYAAEIARRFGSKIVLLRVIPTFPVIAKTTGEPELIADEAASAKITEKEAEALAYIEGVVTNLENKELKTEGVIIKGTPDKAIVTYAKPYDVDLIALVAHGHGGLGRIVSGSIADYVVRESGVPVLVVSPKESES
jgi:nucleotide-binding universal stress UspA family protein